MKLIGRPNEGCDTRGVLGCIHAGRAGSQPASQPASLESDLCARLVTRVARNGKVELNVEPGEPPCQLMNPNKSLLARPSDGGGVGLGMAVCTDSQSASSLSRPGRSRRSALRLPLAPAHEAELSPRRAARRRACPRRPQPPARRRLLTVEDETSPTPRQSAATPSTRHSCLCSLWLLAHAFLFSITK